MNFLQRVVTSLFYPIISQVMHSELTRQTDQMKRAMMSYTPNMATASFTSVRNEADRVTAAGDTPLCAVIDTPPQPLYTRAYILLHTGGVSEPMATWHV